MSSNDRRVFHENLDEDFLNDLSRNEGNYYQEYISDKEKADKLANSNAFLSSGSASLNMMRSNPRLPNSESNANLSRFESAILNSKNPLEINETEEITVLGQRGIWANREEVVNWKGPIPINEYLINEDDNPETLFKKSEQKVEYIQELAIRYLRPPTPPVAGEIIINQESNTFIPPAPPVIIRQLPARPPTPEPIVYREAPPKPPAQVGRKIITISGKKLPPPPRKVIIERLAPIPSKPQSVIIERWLPYNKMKRKVVFKKSYNNDPIIVKPKNVIIQWEAPEVSVKKEFKYLGIIKANPAEYIQRYASSLKTSKELPEFVLDIKPPASVLLAADVPQSNVHELEGDIEALNLVDLVKEGLTEYRDQLNKIDFNGSRIQYQNGSSSIPLNQYVSQHYMHSFVQETTISSTLSHSSLASGNPQRGISN
jgi:hypothetical protein